jgi:hypothetical protein
MITSRGRHPDFDEQGNLKPDAFTEPRRRDFNREYNADPAGFMERVGRWQSRLPIEIQREVQGRTFAPGQDVFDGFHEYLRAVAESRRYWREGEVTSEDVARMTPEEFDRTFDEKGRLREGFTFRPTSRDVPLDSQRMDPSSRQEFRR